MKALRTLATLGSLLLLAACTVIPPLAHIDCAQISSAEFRFTGSPDGLCRWDFGDGTRTAGETVDHAYAERGVYTVNLNVHTADGTCSTAIVVKAGAEWYVNPENRSLLSLDATVQAAEPGDTIYLSGAHGSLILDKALDIVGTNATLTTLIYRNTAGSLSGIRITGDNGHSALVLDHATPHLEDCVVEGNSVGGYGGGIYALDSAATFLRCEIRSNSAACGGGGVYAVGEHSFPQFVDCLFQGNSANAGGGAILVRAWMTQPLQPEAQLLEATECTFLGNSARGRFAGGAVHVGTGCRAKLVDCVYAQNSPADVVREDYY